MPFGLMQAVLDFYCVSEALVALSRRWFGVPVLGFSVVLEKKSVCSYVCLGSLVVSVAIWFLP